jgi:cell division protein FtsW
MSFARTDQSLVAQWWWTVDRWTLLALAALIGFGSLLVMAASPAVAERIHAGGLTHPDGLFFVKRYFAVLPLALAAMFATSLQSPRMVRRIALVGFVLSLILLVYTFVGGVEIKGARRWISLPGLSLQPSEFVKPTFAVVSAWLFAQYRLREDFPGHWIAIALYVLVVGLLIKQPDLGMAVVVSVVWFTQFFLAGMRLYWVAVGMASGAAGLVGA